MLERNVRVGFTQPMDSALMFENLFSRRKTGSCRNTSFLGTKQGRLNPHQGREDLDRLVRWQMAQAVAVEGGGVNAVEAVDVVEEAEAGTSVTGLSRTSTKLRGVITTGNEVMTRRWRGQEHHLHNITVHLSVAARNRKVLMGSKISQISQNLSFFPM
jgi:hypothetical protein